jgi:ribosomal protein S6--L-glutamate ligase
MEKKKIVLLTTEPESFVQEKLAAAAEKAGFDLDVINPDECHIFLSTDTYFANKGTKFEKADACIPRLSEDHLDYKVAIMKHMEKIGVKVLNTGASMRTASNKIETQIILNNEGIQTPKSALFINEEQLDKALESIGGKFPVIVKTIFGTHGVGVMRADSMASLRSICQQLIKSGVEFMLQEYIEHKESARILVLGDSAVAAVLRTIPDGDFRSNAHQGAELKKHNLHKKRLMSVLKHQS